MSNARNHVLTSLLPFFRVKVKGRGQGHGSRSKVKVKGQGQICGAQWSILGARLCRVQQRAKKSHNQSIIGQSAFNSKIFWED